MATRDRRVSSELREAARDMLRRGDDPEDVVEFFVEKGIRPKRASQCAEELDEEVQDQLRADHQAALARAARRRIWFAIAPIPFGILCVLLGNTIGHLPLVFVGVVALKVWHHFFVEWLQDPARREPRD
jgi:hypothetical protein